MMARRKEVIVEFDEFGNPTVTPKGYSGRECLKATEDLERALGLVNADVQPTRDMRAAPERTQGNVRIR